jgi:hypothetical protein
MPNRPNRRWYQFSLKRLIILTAAGPPVLAGGYYLVKEFGLEAIIICVPLLCLFLIIDLLRNRTISVNGKIIWLLMMTISCPVAIMMYGAVRLHEWLKGPAEPVLDSVRDPP